MLLLLLALTFLLSGCAFLGETAPPPTADWQPTREALIEQREVLKERASARQARLLSIQTDAPEQPYQPSGATVAPAPTFTPSQIVADLDKGEVSSEAAGVQYTVTSSIVPRQSIATTPISRPTGTPMPTRISRWAQIQRDYMDERITYDQAVEQAIDNGMSRLLARVALAQIRIQGRWIYLC